MNKYVQMYETGQLTEQNAVYEIFDHCTIDDYKELPDRWQRLLHKYVVVIQENWQQMQTCAFYCGTGGKFPDQDEMRHFSKNRAQYWENAWKAGC